MCWVQWQVKERERESLVLLTWFIKKWFELKNQSFWHIIGMLRYIFICPTIICCVISITSLSLFFFFWKTLARGFYFYFFRGWRIKFYIPGGISARQVLDKEIIVFYFLFGKYIYIYIHHNLFYMWHKSSKSFFNKLLFESVR